jgi:uncharacterized protein YlxP (DUF503 family)
MDVCALEVDLVVEHSASLKDKRAVVRHILDTARRRFGVSASEVGHHDLRQRAVLAFAFVAPGAARVEEVLDQVERFVWAQPSVSVVSTRRRWLEDDGD